MLGFGGLDDGGTPVTFSAIEGFERRGGGGPVVGGGTVSGRWAGPRGCRGEKKPSSTGSCGGR
jgi:hypothetical protein